MNRFYVLLGVVAIGAAAMLWYGTQTKGAGSAGQGGATAVQVSSADRAFRGYTLGSDSAPVEVVEFADFQCPHCGEFATVQFPTIRAQLIATGRLRWRFRDYPLGFPWSRIAASAAQCAGEQGKFWPMADSLFSTQPDWGASRKDPSSRFRDLARAIGASDDAYTTCMDTHKFAGRIEASHQEGDARGVTGTPTFFVGDVELDTRTFNNSDAFKTLVDSLTARRKR
jgi:protein-disulfide isomerase